MALAVLSATYVPLHPYHYGDERPVLVARMSGGAEQRAATLSRRLRTYRLGFRTVAATRLAIDDFFEARGYSLESFLWKDLKDYARTGVTLVPAVGDGAETVFSLPKTGINGGDYPIDQASTLLKVAGVSVGANRTVQTDARTITATGGAPAGGAAITADYEYYKRVRLDGTVQWAEPVFGVFTTEISLVEVPST